MQKNKSQHVYTQIKKLFQLLFTGASTSNHIFSTVSHSFTLPKQLATRIRFTKTIRMLALTLICDPVIVDKLLLHTTVVIRWLTLDSLQNRTSCSINLCGIPRRLGGVEQFLLQTLRRATFFMKETANSNDKDSNLVKEMECSVKCISLNRCWFLFRVCGGEGEHSNCY